MPQLEEGFTPRTVEERLAAIETLLRMRQFTVDFMEVTNTATIDGKLLIQQDDVAKHLASLDGQVASLNAASLQVATVGVTIAHESKAGEGVIPFKSESVTSHAVNGTFGSNVLAAWIVLNDHIANHPLSDRVGYLGATPAGNKVMVGGSATPAFGPTAFNVYVLFVR